MKVIIRRLPDDVFAEILLSPSKSCYSLPLALKRVTTTLLSLARVCACA
jgi:hypothetical protein